jgi:hypothetical protein
MPETAGKWNKIGGIGQEMAARKRASWSALKTPTNENIASVAHLLGFSPEAVGIAAARGLLFCATCLEGSRAFVVSDARRLGAVAYRLDALPWERTNRIARILPGSVEGWPIGIDEATPFPAIALVCGGIDLLAALHLSWCASREDIIAPVAIMPPGGDIADAIADMALTLFKGKVVCLFPHADKAGRQAKAKWGRQLAGIGIKAEIYDLQGLITTDQNPVVTLADFARVDPDYWEEHRDVIERAFCFGPPRQTPRSAP